MKRRRAAADEEGCIDLIERAVYLLRNTRLSVWFLFYIGTVPFLMSVLFFLSDMTAGPFAARRCAGGALLAALLYVWMRVWQALFCRRLLAQVDDTDVDPITIRLVSRLALFHTSRSTWGMLIVPMAAVIAVPFGWVYAYFNNLLIVDRLNLSDQEASEKARELAMPWPRQNHLVISLIWFFGFYVFLNLVTVTVQLPGLLKSLVGIETVFAQSWHWIFNTTFLSILLGVNYLCVEPLIKAAYVLRYQACESIHTGQDILAALRRLPPRRRAARLGILLIAGLLALFSPSGECAAKGTEPGAGIEAGQLDERVEEVLSRREYTWRMPRDLAPESEETKGFFDEFFEYISESLDRISRSIGEAIEQFFRWLGDWISPPDTPTRKTKGIDPSFFRGLSVMLLVVLAGVLLYFLMRAWAGRRAPPPKLDEVRVRPEDVDLDDEQVMATLLEEDEWIRLARDLSAQGEFRKAMRAWFLAALAYLARSGWVMIQPAKSNREYERELARRARRRPDVIPLFTDQVQQFERVWYGLYNASEDGLHTLEHNLEQMRRTDES